MCTHIIMHCSSRPAGWLLCGNLLAVFSQYFQLYNVTVDGNAGSGIRTDLAENSIVLVNKS